MTYVIVIKVSGRAIGKGFWGDNPERWWVDPLSDDAKRFDSKEAAERFARGVGDSSWGLVVYDLLEADFYSDGHKLATSEASVLADPDHHLTSATRHAEGDATNLNRAWWAGYRDALTAAKGKQW